MDSENPSEEPTEEQPVKRRRGRRPKSETATAASNLKSIEVDAELRELIDRKNPSVPTEAVRVKLPASVMAELKLNIDSLNSTANSRVDVNDYIGYALELANENLAAILKKHLTR